MTPAQALRLIISARDHCAEHGDYPASMHAEEGQAFDDWAADLAQRVLDEEPAKGFTITFSDDACDTWIQMLQVSLTYCVCINQIDRQLEAVTVEGVSVRDWNRGAPERQPLVFIPWSNVTSVHVY